MNRNQLKSYLRYRLKARHRRGFGVHSPFVFDFLNFVIFEKNHYYAYEKISAFYQKNNAPFSEKYARLLFRLMNFSSAKNVVEIGENFFENALEISTQKNFSQNNFAFISLEKLSEQMFSELEKTLSQNHENAIFVFNNIYFSKQTQAFWNSICKKNNVNLSLDLFQFGIVIFKNQLPKQHYIIAF